MIPNHYWVNNFECHFEPSLKHNQRELYDFFTSKVEEIGLKLVLLPEGGPCFIFYSDVSYLKQISTFSISDVFLVKVTGQVLSMDLEETDSCDAFEVSSTSEWDDLYSMIKMVVDLWGNHQCELVYKKAKIELKKMTSSKVDNLGSISELEQLENELMSAMFVEDMCQIFNESELSQKFGLQVRKLSEVIFDKEKKIILPFYLGKSDDWVLQCLNAVSESIASIYWILYVNFFRFYILDESQNIRNCWEQVFSLIDTPLAIIDESQHLVLHNSEFVKLSFSQRKCLKLNDNEQIQIGSELYRVRKKHIKMGDKDCTLINFILLEDSFAMSNTSAEELGIVSSSLAHELNNPLAGILAALTVISMDELDEEVSLRIDEMKNGVNRCKQLVETFLGFSRARTISGEGQIFNISVQRTFDQALELMRFRMIENNLKFSIDYQLQDAFIAPFNPSILSMLFYLVLGEIVTSFSHYILVSESKSDVIKLIVKEKHTYLSIEWEYGLSLPASFSKSKLVQHLVESQSAKMEIQEGITFHF